MKIIYQIPISPTDLIDALDEGISTEGVGFETGFNSSAKLRHINNAVEIPAISEEIVTLLVPCEEQRVFTDAHAAEDAKIMWETAWSRYAYLFLGGDVQEETSFVLYDGAQNGFLRQDLLPGELGESAEVLWIEGTYGTYSSTKVGGESDDPLSDYSRVKDAWRKQVLSSRIEKSLRVLLNRGTEDVPDVMASLWRLLQRRVDSEDDPKDVFVKKVLSS